MLKKSTWMHARSRQWHLLDYVLIRMRDQRDVLVTKAIPDADGRTDNLSNELPKRLGNLTVAVAAADENASMENRLRQQRDTVQSTALAVLGRARRQHQEWFDDNDAVISNLLAEQNRLHSLRRPSHRRKPRYFLSQSSPHSTATARDSGRLNDSQGQGDPRVRGPQRVEELLLHDQSCLRFANHRQCCSPHRRRQYPPH
nr:unnamed protein product [Spirometra erinaceieuropaei]